MRSNMLVEDAAGDVIKKLNELGWNLYKKTKPYNQEATIAEGPAREFEVGCPYILLPNAEDPKNPKKVMDALEKLAVQLNRELPTITIDGFKTPCLGFTPMRDYAHLHTPEGLDVPYEKFICSIETMVNTTLQ